MYDELIKRLRELPHLLFVQLHGHEDTVYKAADAIEELSKKRVGTWHRFKATQRSYSFVCNSCDSICPYLTRCCPNCGVEYIGEEPQKEE